MRLLSIFILLSLVIRAQTCLIRFDNMESYDWLNSGWAVGFQGNYYTNAFVSATASGALIGNGSGTSAYESGYYILSNVTGLLPTYTHELRFRLASYRFSNPTAATAGVDLQDYVDVQVSTNGGTTYTTELRIPGNNNAYWSYNSTSTVTKAVTGTMATVGPVGGGDRTATGDGYSYINITIPSGTTQVAFRLFMRANAAGEEWWIDNVELHQLGPCLLLPIQLITFTAYSETEDVFLNWTTASESNNQYFKIERSKDAVDWEPIGMVPGIGNSITEKHYSFVDYKLQPGSYYYRLRQVDMNGDKHYSNIIEVKVNDTGNCNTYEYYNLTGSEIDIETAPTGIYIRKCGRKYVKIFKD